MGLENNKMVKWCDKFLVRVQTGQSLVEFALILPLFVLFVVGIFELGRAFFSFIAITNGAREGARVVTFWPGKATILNVDNAIKDEVGSSPMVDLSKINAIQIECGSPFTGVTTDAALAACPSEQPIRVTVIYEFDFILNLFFPQPLMLKRSEEMMIP